MLVLTQAEGSAEAALIPAAMVMYNPDLTDVNCIFVSFSSPNHPNHKILLRALVHEFLFLKHADGTACATHGILAPVALLCMVASYPISCWMVEDQSMSVLSCDRRTCALVGFFLDQK